MSTNSRKILVVDDEPAMRAMAKAMLESMGYTPVLANSGEQAIDLYHQSLLDGEEIAMGIMDLTLPGGMSGVEALQELQDMEGELPVVASSGYLEANAYDICQQIGFVGVLPKPYSADKLNALVTWVISRRGIPGGYDEGMPRPEEEKQEGDDREDNLERNGATAPQSLEMPHAPAPEMPHAPSPQLPHAPQVETQSLPTQPVAPEPVAPTGELQEAVAVEQPVTDSVPQTGPLLTQPEVQSEQVPATAPLEQHEQPIDTAPLMQEEVPQTGHLVEAQAEAPQVVEEPAVVQEANAVVEQEPVMEQPAPVPQEVVEAPPAVETGELAPVVEAPITDHLHQPEVVAEPQTAELPVVEAEVQDEPGVGGIADRLSDLVDFAVSNRKG